MIGRGKGIVPSHVLERREQIYREIAAFAAKLHMEGASDSDSKIESFKREKEEELAVWEAFYA